MGSSVHLSIYLVRHGLTKWNVEKRYLGHTDLSLLEHKKNELMGLKIKVKDVNFESVYCSDLTRCKETLEFLIPNVKTHFDARLRELHFGDWEGKTYDQLKNIEAYSKWLNNWDKLAPPNGESGVQFSNRIDSFMSELLNSAEHENYEKHNDKQLLIVSHGGVIRYILSKLVPDKTLWEWDIKHGRAIHLLLGWKKGEWICSSWSEVPMPEKEA
jgi:alpha-ribazole phosphatase